MFGNIISRFQFDGSNNISEKKVGTEATKDYKTYNAKRKYFVETRNEFICPGKHYNEALRRLMLEMSISLMLLMDVRHLRRLRLELPLPFISIC